MNYNYTKIILPILLACSFFSFAETNQPVSTNERSVEAKEIYGPADAPLELMIGNGGAGPTCVLQELSEDFIYSEGLNIQIGWIQNITRLTLENLKERVIDLSLTYEAEPEFKAIKEGWADQRHLIFNDHFVIVGPKSNPANLNSQDTPQEAFAKIAESGAFFSRNDASGTNDREKEIWQAIGLAPWETNPSWYITENVFPADSVKIAEQKNLYTLTDRGTLLASHEDLNNTFLYIQEGEILMNRCHALVQKNSSPLALKFLEYLKSERAQKIISEYAGKDKKDCTDCCPLFSPADNDEFLEKDCLKKLGLQF